MKTPSIPVLAAALLAALIHSEASAERAARITNHEAEGNLQSTVELGCIPVREARNVYTPADLYKAVAKCIESGNPTDGVPLYALAGVYGRFDTLRVPDRSAHQALLALQFENISSIDEEKMNLFRTQMGRTAGDASALAAMCAQLRDVGPPDYYPRYMVQHGMGAFLGGGGDGLAPDFDAASSWEKSLDSYLHCPPAPATEG